MILRLSLSLSRNDLGPAVDDQNNASYIFHTEYRVERFYPVRLSSVHGDVWLTSPVRQSYYDSPRPRPTGLPRSISYGGDYFDITLPSSDLVDVDLASDVAIVLIRTGFSSESFQNSRRQAS